MLDTSHKKGLLLTAPKYALTSRLPPQETSPQYTPPTGGIEASNEYNQQITYIIHSQPLVIVQYTHVVWLHPTHMNNTIKLTASEHVFSASTN